MASEAEILSGLTPDTAEAVSSLLEWSDSQGLEISVISGPRTCEEQMELYAQGRTAPGRIVTGAPGCKSWHTHGRAVDVYAGSWEPADYTAIGERWRSMGGGWGGAWGDYGHLEWHPGLSIEDVCPDPEGSCPRSFRPAAMLAGVGMAAVGLSVAAYILLRRTP